MTKVSAITKEMDVIHF